jgi:hypothetical protein
MASTDSDHQDLPVFTEHIVDDMIAGESSLSGNNRCLHNKVAVDQVHRQFVFSPVRNLAR